MDISVREIVRIVVQSSGHEDYFVDLKSLFSNWCMDEGDVWHVGRFGNFLQIGCGNPQVANKVIEIMDGIGEHRRENHWRDGWNDFYEVSIFDL